MFTLCNLARMKKLKTLKRYFYYLLFIIAMLSLFSYKSKLLKKKLDMNVNTNLPVNVTQQITRNLSKRFSNLAIATKTGVHVMQKRLPGQIHTFLKEMENKIIVGDVNAHIEGVEIIKVAKEPVKSEGWNNDASKFFPGLLELYKRFPNAEWYIFIDDDSYLFLDNLQHKLHSWDSSKPYYLGMAHMFANCGGVKKMGDGPLFAQGGAGIFLSKPALVKMIEIIPTCIQDYSGCWAGDVQVSLCLRDAGILLQGLDGLSTGVPDDSFKFPQDPCALPVSFHHIDPSLSKRLNTWQSRKEPGYLMTMADVVQSLLPEMDSMKYHIDRQGADLHTTASNSAFQCEMQCKNYPTCASWVYGRLESMCWLRNHIPGGIKREGYVSGVVSKHYKCVEMD